MAFDLSKLLAGVSDPGTREQIEYLRLGQIENDPHNFYQLSDIEKLADNIQLCGLQQPIRVRPIPGDTEKYRIVSGHRRRAAVELLAKEDPQRWDEVACIVESDAASESLQQLRLIFANSNTRTMTAAEISEQAVQTEALLYKLKEEEGFEFPGRMRDHVAEVVGASKSKLARLKVIRENLAKCWMPKWKSGVLNESVAYELAQMPEAWQTTIHAVRAGRNLDAKYVKIFKERFEKIDSLKCKTMPGYEYCHNADRKRSHSAEDAYGSFHCGKCCSKCPDLISCKEACPVMASKVKELKADRREARKQVREAQAEKDRPAVEQVSALWQRFGLARELAGKTFDECKRALGIGYFAFDAEKVMKLECGEAKVSPDTKLPYNYNCYLSDVTRLITLADLFGCSVDYLLCRTDIKEMAQTGSAVPDSDIRDEHRNFIPGAWYPVSVEPPVGVRLILMDSGGYVDTGKYIGCGEYTMDYGDPVTLWTLEPKEKDAIASTPVSESDTGWKTGKPEAYGTYVAYVQMPHSTKQMLRELQWDGEAWFLFGTKIDDDVRICCWTEQPEV